MHLLFLCDKEDNQTFNRVYSFLLTGLFILFSVFTRSLPTHYLLLAPKAGIQNQDREQTKLFPGKQTKVKLPS